MGRTRPPTRLGWHRRLTPARAPALRVRHGRLGVSVEDSSNFPHLQSVKNCFIRGSVIKYVQLPAAEVDTELLHDAARREAAQQKGT